jgi:hypothetical protein
MKQHAVFAGCKSGLFSLAIAAAALVTTSAESRAAGVSITNANSTITVDPSSVSGMSAWTVDGFNVVNQQSFFFRDPSSPGNTAQSISAIGTPTFSANGQLLTTTYSNSDISMQVNYTLLGGSVGSHSSSISEQINITYLGSSLSGLDFHFFQFANFVGNGDVSLFKLGSQYVFASVSGGGMVVNESLNTSLNPLANEGETASGTLGSITGTAGYNLNGTTSGPGLGQWGFQWDTTLLPGQTFQIGKLLGANGVPPVPEPPAWALVTIGMFAFGALRHYRNRRS